MTRPIAAATWAEFDLAARVLAGFIPPGTTALLAIPRGGLVLGVALSHLTGLPLLTHPGQVSGPGVCIVDEIADSGRTLARLRAMLGHPAPALVWFRRGACPEAAHAFRVVGPDEWILFPWESASAVAADAECYRAAAG